MRENIVLITGGTGFIGSHVLDYFLKKESITKIYLVSRKDIKVQNNKIKLIKTDLLDFDRLNEKVISLDVSIIVNCAGKLGGPLISREELLNSNYLVVKNLVDLYDKEQNIDQFIHISSFGVLGPIPKNRIPANENYPYNPSNDYEKSKMLGELYVLSSNLPYTVVRPEFVYGPRDMHLLPFFRRIISQKFYLINGGKTFIHPTYIADVIQTINKVILKKTKGEVFNIGGERYLTIKEFVQTLYSIVSKNRKYTFKSIPVYCIYPAAILGEFLKKFKMDFPLNIQRLKFFIENRAVDYTKAKKILEYEPTPLIEGLKATIRWYCEHGYL